MHRSFSIAGHEVGEGSPTFVIAEISANHNQDLALARETIAAAAEAGADAVKFQTYTADELTFNGDGPWFRINEGTSWDGRTLHDIYSEGHMPWEWHSELFTFAQERGLIAFSSPFSARAVSLLEELDAPAYKIASFEIFDHELIAAAASTGKPVIISTGVATREDVRQALDVCVRSGNEDVAILKCTSAYPAPARELNLRTIPDMAAMFECTVGFSDHTMGLAAPLGAVSLGASIIERHLTLDRDKGGLDSSFSTSAEEFAELVKAIRELEEGLGKISYELSVSSVRNRRFGRSLFVVEDVVAGQEITRDNVRSIRPADGMLPRELPKVLGSRFTRDVSAGTPLSPELFVTGE